MIWFTSDQHFGHLRILDLAHRPFASVEEMNETMIERWNGVVAPDDMVYIVGDLCMGTFAESTQLVPRLAGTKYLVPGNHDRCHEAYPCKPAKRKQFLDMYWSVGLHVLPNQIQFREFEVCHFPYEDDEDRYVQYRPRDHGKPLIHGHVHEAWRTRGRMFNCGVDVNDFRPVSIDEVRKLLGDRERQ